VIHNVVSGYWPVRYGHTNYQELPTNTIYRQQKRDFETYTTTDKIPAITRPTYRQTPAKGNDILSVHCTGVLLKTAKDHKWLQGDYKINDYH